MLSKLGALAIADPNAASRIICKAIVDANGDRANAAASLDVPIRTLYRLIGKLDLWATIDQLAAEHRFPHRNRPPRAGE